MSSRRAIGGKIEGLERSKRALEKIIRAEQAAAPKALELIGQQATTEVKRRAPVATGTLRRSYGWETGRDGRKAWVEIGTNVEYAPYQEFGTAHQQGTPHMRPGIDAVKPLVGRLVAESVGRAGRGASFGGSVAKTASTLKALARGVDL